MTTTNPNPATFDEAFTKAAAVMLTRAPEAIERDIERHRQAQRDAVGHALELTRTAITHDRIKLAGPEAMAERPEHRAAIAKLRERYDAATGELNELQEELRVARNARA